MRHFLQTLLCVVLASFTLLSHADDNDDKAREALITANPELKAVINGSCKNADAKKLSQKYILKEGSELSTDQDVPGSRIWIFSNLKNDLVASLMGKGNGPSIECLDDLAAAGIKEQIRYWKIRKAAASCSDQPPKDEKECNWVDHNLSYALAESQNFKKLLYDAIAAAKKAGQEKTAGLESCTDCAGADSKNISSLAAITQKAKAQACCETFRKRDGELTEAQCTAMQTGSQPVNNSELAQDFDCAKNFGKTFIKGLWNASIGGAISFAQSWFDGSLRAGIVMLQHEISKDPAHAMELIMPALEKIFGIDHAYENCLHDSLKAKYQCEKYGTMISQMTMMVGGYAVVLKALKLGAGGVAQIASKIPDFKKITDAAKATRAVVGIKATAALSVGIRSVKEMTEIVKNLKCIKVVGEKVTIAKNAVSRLKPKASEAPYTRIEPTLSTSPTETIAKTAAKDAETLQKASAPAQAPAPGQAQAPAQAPVQAPAPVQASVPQSVQSSFSKLQKERAELVEQRRASKDPLDKQKLTEEIKRIDNDKSLNEGNAPATEAAASHASSTATSKLHAERAKLAEQRRTSKDTIDQQKLTEEIERIDKSLNGGKAPAPETAASHASSTAAKHTDLHGQKAEATANAATAAIKPSLIKNLSQKMSNIRKTYSEFRARSSALSKEMKALEENTKVLKKQKTKFAKDLKKAERSNDGAAQSEKLRKQLMEVEKTIASNKIEIKHIKETRVTEFNIFKKWRRKNRSVLKGMIGTGIIALDQAAIQAPELQQKEEKAKAKVPVAPESPTDLPDVLPSAPVTPATTAPAATTKAPSAQPEAAKPNAAKTDPDKADEPKADATAVQPEGP